MKRKLQPFTNILFIQLSSDIKERLKNDDQILKERKQKKLKRDLWDYRNNRVYKWKIAPNTTTVGVSWRNPRFEDLRKMDRSGENTPTKNLIREPTNSIGNIRKNAEGQTKYKTMIQPERKEVHPGPSGTSKFFHPNRYSPLRNTNVPFMRGGRAPR